MLETTNEKTIEETTDTASENTNNESKTIPYDRFKEVNDKFKMVQSELETLKLQNATYSEKLKTAISEDDFIKFKSDAESEYNTKLNQFKISGTLETELLKQGIKSEYSSMILSQIDTSALKINDMGKIIDSNGISLEEIVSSKKETYPDLFGRITVISKGVAGNPEPGAVPNTNTDLDEINNLRKYMGLKK